MGEWQDKQLRKWMRQVDKRISPSRAWYWHRLHSRLDELVCRAIREHGTSGTLLDYGGGLAPLSRHWHRRFPDWCTVVSDLSEADLRTVKLAEQPPHTVVLHAEQPAIRPASLDIIVCSEVVEHLPAPKRLLEDFHTWLKPGGLLLLSTPNGGHPLVESEEGEQQGSHELLATNEVGYGHISVHPTRQWMAWLEEIGFEQVRPYRGALLFGGPKWDRAHRLLPLMAAEILLDLLRAWNWSESAIIGARKHG